MDAYCFGSTPWLGSNGQPYEVFDLPQGPAKQIFVLFNAGFGGKVWRAIDFSEGDKINERALKNLVRAAVDYNQIKLKRKAPAGTRRGAPGSSR